MNSPFRPTCESKLDQNQEFCISSLENYGIRNLIYLLISNWYKVVRLWQLEGIILYTKILLRSTGFKDLRALHLLGELPGRSTSKLKKISFLSRSDINSVMKQYIDLQAIKLPYMHHHFINRNLKKEV